MKMIILLAFTLIVIPVHGINYTDCSQPDRAKIYDVRVSGCENKDFCPLYRNRTTIFNMDFEVNSQYDGLKTVVSGVLSGLELPFTPPQKDACKDSGLTCPIAPDEELNYVSYIPVKSYFPILNVLVIWRLKNGTDEVTCVKIPSKIEDYTG